VTDVDESGDWLERWASDVHASAERAATLSRRVAALVGRASSADGSIRVTVNSSGHLSTLDLDDRATDLRGDELSRRILAVIRQARHDVAAQVPTEVGTGTATSRAAIRSFAKRFPA
jgi:DNA-binding protein YbaB